MVSVMESNRNAYSSPNNPSQSPVDHGASRIAIDSLLNPSGNSGDAGTSHTPREDRTSYYHQSPYYSYPTPQSTPFHYARSFAGQQGGHHDLSDQRSRSTNSSPGPYQRSEVSPSSTGGAASAPGRRAPRPKYEEEEMYFIWYHRVDLRQEWRQVRENFNTQFPDRQRSGFQGIQCKFYRFIKEKRCPTLRDQKQQENQYGKRKSSPGDDGPAYGVVKWTGAWFPWMKEPPPSHYH